MTETAPQKDARLAPLTAADLPTLSAWFEDGELRRRLGGMLPLGDYLAFVQRTPGYFAWMAWDGEAPVGAAFLQQEPDSPQSFAFLVGPLLRGQGHGQRIVRALLTRPEAAPVQNWRVSVEPDNAASQRCLSAAGFVPERDEPDADGFLTYTMFKKG